MLRFSPLRALLLLAPLAAACGSDDSTPPSNGPDPIAVTETFNGTLNPNGGRVHQFDVVKAGQVTAKITALTPDDTITVGLSIGTWNGVYCAATLPNDAAKLNTTILGSAQTGQFCTRIYDAAGTLTTNTDYTIEVTHF